MLLKFKELCSGGVKMCIKRCYSSAHTIYSLSSGKFRDILVVLLSVMVS